ncbi:MAG: hypothetical protein J5753_05730 [Oscillospiraceae bacterium]|nr:hypothetical protein [Oscillospiraceae bacterium]
MKKLRFLPVILCAAVCLTGCGQRYDLTEQEDAVPVVPLETTFAVQTDHSSSTESTTASATNPTTVRQTTVLRTTAAGTEPASVTSQTAANTAETAAPQNKSDSNSGGSGGTAAKDLLYGKWETVSFSKNSGARISYDLSDPAHRSYYVGLDLNENGQSSVTVGTDEQPVTISLRGNTLTVMGTSRDKSVTLDFTVSADRKSMTVELMNGRIIATLTRINRDFSIRQYEAQAPDADFSLIAGEWNYQVESEIESIFSTVGFVTVQPDHTYYYQPADGTIRRKGTVRTEYEETADGEKNPYFAFYEDDSNELWSRTESSTPGGRGNFTLVGSGNKRLSPWNMQGNKFDRYVGQWQSGRCSIQIGRDEDDYIVQCIWSTGASEYSEWNYRCTGNDDQMTLECTGGGTLFRAVTAPDSSESRTEVYNDGTAVFSMNGSRLFWTDQKENVSEQMEFTLLG